MIDKIDKDRKYIDHRLYRDSCVFTDGLYIKDLRVLNRDIRKIVIIDNAVISFGFQLENGIPILPFYDDYTDDCLFKITSYLKYLSCVDDMRFANNEKFGLLEIKESQFNLFLDYYLGDEEEEGSESPSSHENSVSPNKGKNDGFSAMPIISLHQVGMDALDELYLGTSSRKMSLTKKSEKEISENMSIIHKCIGTLFSQQGKNEG
jgi:hypothetical protein